MGAYRHKVPRAHTIFLRSDRKFVWDLTNSASPQKGIKTLIKDSLMLLTFIRSIIPIDMFRITVDETKNKSNAVLVNKFTMKHRKFNFCYTTLSIENTYMYGGVLLKVLNIHNRRFIQCIHPLIFKFVLLNLNQFKYSCLSCVFQLY